MPYFRTEDGCRLYYETIGMETTKPVIVFLNGTIQNTVHWKSQVNYLKDRYRLLLYDGRAQGRSDLGEIPLGIDIHAADLSALLRYLNIAKTNLVGSSHGARVALETAVHYPHCVTRVAMCSISDRLNDRTCATLRIWRDILATSGLEAAAWAMLPTVLGSAFLEENRRMLPKIVKAIILRNRPASLLAHFDAMLADSRRLPPAVKAGSPALVISGEQDPLVSPEGARRLADQLGGTHVLMNGVGHTIQIEAPDRLNRELDAFLMSEER